MSRAYRIRVAERARRHVQVADGVCTDIELLPILPRDRLAQLLADELGRRGFEVEEGKARRVDDDVELEVDLASARVSARIEHEEEVERSASTTVRAASRTLDERHTDRVRAELRERADRQIEAEKERLQREVTERLEKKLHDLQQELDEVSTRVAGAALKEKARQLGEVTELVEGEDGSLTIKVKV